jgi:hypothetical protein
MNTLILPTYKKVFTVVVDSITKIDIPDTPLYFENNQDHLWKYARIVAIPYPHKYLDVECNWAFNITTINGVFNSPTPHYQLEQYIVLEKDLYEDLSSEHTKFKISNTIINGWVTSKLKPMKEEVYNSILTQIVNSILNTNKC